MLMTSVLSDQDLYLFNEGTHVRLFEKLARIRAIPMARRTRASRFEPNAERVSVMGDFNDWSTTSHALESQGDSGIWEGSYPRSLLERDTSTTLSRAIATMKSTRAIRSRSAPRSRHKPHRSFGTCTTTGRIAAG